MTARADLATLDAEIAAAGEQVVIATDNLAELLTVMVDLARRRSALTNQLSIAMDPRHRDVRELALELFWSRCSALTPYVPSTSPATGDAAAARLMGRGPRYGSHRKPPPRLTPEGSV